MADISSHTIVKNGADFIESCLRQVLPFMKTSYVSVDTCSSDGTVTILQRLEQEYINLKLDYFTPGEDWQHDTTDAFNRQLSKIQSTWILAMDDDEYWATLELKKLMRLLDEAKQEDNGYAFHGYYLIDKEHIYTAKNWDGFSDRVFRNKPNLQWKYCFPPIKIYDGKNPLYWRRNKTVKQVENIEFIHFSLLKKSSWRKDICQVQPEIGNYVPRYIKRVPDWVIKEIEKQ